MKHTLLLTLLSVFLASCDNKDKITHDGTAQTNYNILKMDSLVDILHQNNRFMGSISLMKNDTVIYSKVVGFNDMESQLVSSEETKYRIGSISKIFTSAMLFRAIEENKIELSQTIDNYFPTIENADKITIGNLLNHRSGIHNLTKDESFLAYRTEYKSPDELVEIISAFESDFEPNSHGDYSNSNYILLSVILEDIYSSSFKKLVKEKICVPLDLKNTYYGDKINLENDESNSYKFDSEWVKETETNLSIPMGAGALVSTPVELNKFITALFSHQIISQESLEKMTTITDNYGMGIFQYPYNDHIGYGHGGNIDGFNAITIYLPEPGIALSITSNAINYSMSNLAKDLLNCYFNIPFDLPQFDHVEISEEDLLIYAGSYSTEGFPGVFTVTIQNGVLHTQLNDGPNDPLIYKGNNKFLNEEVGATFTFKPEQNQMELEQSGMSEVYIYTKQE